MKKKASDKLYQMGIKGEYFCTKTLNGFESYFNGPFVFFSVQAVVVALFLWARISFAMFTERINVWVLD